MFSRGLLILPVLGELAFQLGNLRSEFVDPGGVIRLLRAFQFALFANRLGSERVTVLAVKASVLIPRREPLGGKVTGLEGDDLLQGQKLLRTTERLKNTHRR